VIFFFALLALILVWCAIQFRYYFVRQWSRRWPSVTATIQRGEVSRVSGPKGSVAFGSFFGYAFALNGARYVGLFALIGNEEHGQNLQNKLAGKEILVRYNPGNPNVSFVGDIYDSRFEGLTATQNPQWLDSYSGSRIPFST
jgi:hypothetical protein